MAGIFKKRSKMVKRNKIYFCRSKKTICRGKFSSFLATVSDFTIDLLLKLDIVKCFVCNYLSEVSDCLTLKKVAREKFSINGNKTHLGLGQVRQ